MFRRELFAAVSSLALLAMSPAQKVLLDGKSTGPSLDLNFLGGAVDSRIAFTRASGASYYDATGTLQVAASNTPRIDYGPTQFVTNTIRNSSMVGVAAGTPGTLPTNWTIGGNLLTFGITQTIVGSGTENGFPYVDIQLSGTTNTASGFVSFFFETLTQIPALSGQTWTASAGIRLVGGSFANISGMALNVNGRALAGGNNEAFGVAIVPTAAALTAQNRFTQSGTFVSGTTVWATSSYTFNAASSGVAINATLRIAAPQLELGAVANPWVPTTTVAVTVPGPNVGVTNFVRNSVAAGGSAGTPGTPPTDWSFPVPVGLTVQSLGASTEGGLPCLDVRISGTAGASSTGAFAFSPNFAGTIGQTWTAAANLRVLAGSTTGISSLRLQTNESTAAGAFLTQGNGGGFQGTISGAALNTQRFSYTYTTTAALCGQVNSFVFLSFTNGATVDITLRLAAPQLELGAVANPWVPTSGTIATVGAIPLGLLIEEARTNGIRNPRCEGAVAGTPGTQPTNFTISAAGGLTSSVVGSGSENGVPYLDVRYNGTTSNTNGCYISSELASQVAAVSGQVWTLSGYHRLIAGSLTGITSIQLLLLDMDSTPSQVGFAAGSNIIPTSASLSSQRSSLTHTIAAATTASLIPRLSIAIPTATAIDITLRIGAPQLELGAFASSPILPAIGTPAATTRAIDVASMPVGTWFNASAGTLTAGGMLPVSGAANAAAFAQLDDGGNVNRVVLYSSAALNLSVFLSSGSTQILLVDPLAVVTAGAAFKYGVSFTAGSQAVSANGSAPTLFNSGLQPASITTLRIGAKLGTILGSAYVRRVRYWPRALAAAELQGVTT